MHACSVASDSVTLWTMAHQAPLSWGSPGKNIRVGCHALLQRIFLTQGPNLHLLCLLHCTWILYHWATRQALWRPCCTQIAKSTPDFYRFAGNDVNYISYQTTRKKETLFEEICKWLKGQLFQNPGAKVNMEIYIKSLNSKLLLIMI